MAADLAELTQALPGLCEQLEGRLHALEPFRALQQLAAREAGGAPIEAMASSELRAHLERELDASPEYRVLRLLHALRCELNGAPVAVPAEQVAIMLPAAPVALEPPVVPVEAAAEPAVAPAVEPVDFALPAPSAETDVPASAAQWQTDDLHSEASQAVASVFAVAAPAVMEAAEAPLPVAERVDPPPLVAKAAVNEPAVAAAPPALPAPPILVAFEPPRHAEIAEAEATVMASLARLRAAEEEAARAAAQAAKTPPPLVAPPSASMEGAMANVAAAVAATVAAAGRIAEPKPTGFPVSRPAARSVASPLANTWRERQPSPTVVATAEATEIRFVERPASPMLDIAPRQKPSPLADVPVAPIVALRPIVTSGDHAARDWEEAVVEIRRSGADRAPTTDSTRADPAAARAGRAGVAFGRFVKSLKGEKA